MSDGLPIATKKHLYKQEYTHAKELSIAEEVLRPLRQYVLQQVAPSPLVQLSLSDKKL